MWDWWLVFIPVLFVLKSRLSIICLPIKTSWKWRDPQPREADAKSHVSSQHHQIPCFVIVLTERLPVAELTLWAFSETAQSLESCFSPLLVTKGYHGSPERQAWRSKVSLNCSIDRGQWDGGLVLSIASTVISFVFSYTFSHLDLVQ